MDAATLSIIASVVGTGVAIAIFGWRVIVRLEARLDRKIERLEDRLGARMDRAEEARQSDVRDFNARMDRAEEARQSDVRDFSARMDRAEDARQSDVREISGQVGELRERMARIEGLIEGLREAVTGRRAA